MKKADKIKILLLSDAIMSLDAGGISQTLYNLFSFMDPKDFLAIAPQEELKEKKPSPPYESCYVGYQSFWLKIPNNRLTRRILPLTQKLNYSICQLKSYSKIKKAIAQFNPDVVISCSNSPIGILMHNKLLKGYNGKVIPYFMDDWMYQSKIEWFGGSVNNIVEDMLTQNSEWIMISNELADIFKERYHINQKTVLAARNPVDLNNGPADRPYVKGKPFTIAYAGALWPMHFDSFCAIAKAVQKLSATEDIKLVWYGSPDYWEWRKTDLIPLGVAFGGHVPYQKVHETLNKADLLLITSSFDKEYYTHSKGSLQTKITDYCKAKRLIISCGPEYSANHNFIKQAQCGICFETKDTDIIAAQISTIMNNMSDYDQLISNGWESLKMFSKEVVHGNMQRFLTSVIEGGEALSK